MLNRSEEGLVMSGKIAIVIARERWEWDTAQAMGVESWFTCGNSVKRQTFAFRFSVTG